MLLQAPPFNDANPAYPMDFCVEYHDLVVFADFTHRLATIAGFKQMTIPPAEATSDSSFEDGDISSEEFDDHKSENHIIINHELKMQFHLDPARPKIKFIEGLPMDYTFHNGVFEYPAIGQRFLAVNPQRCNRAKRVVIVVANLTLQVAMPNGGGGGPVRRARGRPPAQLQQYVDVSEQGNDGEMLFCFDLYGSSFRLFNKTK
ncbi:unnamed protein product, partial [Mesorhabditis belari]|uniref:Uncharacterized protein n=1 Tax=Mesorhabditis belari TaxID=2138241 RepID=A0AAF3EI12_9BILA